MQAALPAPAGAGVESVREPAAAEHQTRQPRGERRARGQGDVGAVDQQQAAEEQGLDVGAGAEHVAGEDHAAGEAPDEHQGDDAVALGLAPAGKRRVAAAEQERRSERTDRRAEPEAVGEDQAGEGGRADRVGEEGEAAQHDPGAEQARREGQQEDLEKGALDEGQLEGLEHEPEA